MTAARAARTRALALARGLNHVIDIEVALARERKAMTRRAWVRKLHAARARTRTYARACTHVYYY